MMTAERSYLSDLGFATIRALETDEGILASGRDELFGCIFGRDSLLSALQLLRAYKTNNDPYLLALVKKILFGIAALQGTAVNIESGEEPGKCIHEFRRDRHEHLTVRAEKPWYRYQDGTMRSFDSVDATPLFLIAVHEYHRVSGDEAALAQLLPHVHAALDWLFTYGDSNGDGFIDYRLDSARTYGGLSTHSWMDSADSAFLDDGAEPAYPIAPVEVQAYAWAALRRWGTHFEKTGDHHESTRLLDRALALKHAFNEHFVIFEESAFSLCFAIDGYGRAMKAPRSSMGHVLWAGYENENGNRGSVLQDDLVPLLVERLMRNDLFVPTAGIRTLSSLAKQFHAVSYHNGSIWPHDTEMIASGFEQFGFAEEAARVRRALTSAFLHFKTPVELFCFDKDYCEYVSESGQSACRTQAWSAAALIAVTSNISC